MERKKRREEENNERGSKKRSYNDRNRMNSNVNRNGRNYKARQLTNLEKEIANQTATHRSNDRARF